MRNAAGELADSFHLLRLPQLSFRLGPLRDRSFDALLKRFVGLPQYTFGVLAVLDVYD